MDCESGLNLFLTYFQSHLSPSFSAWRLLENFLSSQTESIQDDLVAKAQRHSRYPVCPAFQREVGLWMKEQCDARGWKVHPVFADMASKTEAKDEYIFKWYDHGREKVVLLEENRDPIGHGTTGLITWQGSMLLLNWAETFATFIQDKIVIELGSGVGFFGISLAKLSQPRHVILTDVHPTVLKFLRINRVLNFGQVSDQLDLGTWSQQVPTLETKDYTMDESATPVSIQSLDWTNFKSEDLPSADVIVASDVVYSPELVSPLVRVIQALLDSNAGRGCEAFIACTHRNGQSIELFKQSLQFSGLHYQVFLRRTFSPDDGLVVNHEPLKTITLLRISRTDPRSQIQMV